MDSRGLWYVVEVDRSQLGWTRRPKVVVPDSSGRERPPTTPRLAKDAPAARRVDALWKRGGSSWELFHFKNTHKGPVVVICAIRDSDDSLVPCTCVRLPLWTFPVIFALCCGDGGM